MRDVDKLVLRGILRRLLESEDLSKTAKWKWNPFKQEYLKYTLPPLILTGMLGLVGGAEHLVRSLSYRRSLKKLFERNPDLKKFPKEKVEYLFATLYHLNPELAKRPGVAGPWIRSTLTTSPVEGLPLEMAKEVLEAANKPLSKKLVETAGTSAIESTLSSYMDQIMRQQFGGD